ncbi:MAG TPA: 4-hydroxybenzoate octaprenyltransferase [Steroidobacteraceae bacterium]|nr:4-hydroxybenzoate octaprenyltransferase [Steroidobacteraceae bacterium]
MKAAAQQLSRLRRSIASLPLFTAGLPRVGDTLKQYALLMRMHRPIGIWLLMWPALWALWVSSGGNPDERIFAVFLAGVFIMRSAGCVMNDYADRDIDPFVARTRDRPLAARRVSPQEALLLFAALALLAIGLMLTLNPLAQRLALIGAVLTITYPFLKRFFPLPQFYLGAAFGMAVPMAFAAQTEEVSRQAWLMFLATVLWAGVYDTMYAMVDREDDVRLGVKSSAILFADADRFIIGAMQVMVLIGLGLMGRELEFGLWYWVGLGIAALFFLYQQWLIRKREPAACFEAFNNNNYVGMAIFVGIALNYQFA